MGGSEGVRAQPLALSLFITVMFPEQKSSFSRLSGNPGQKYPQSVSVEHIVNKFNGQIFSINSQL